MNDLNRNRSELEQRREQNERAEKGPDTLAKAKTRLYDKIKARVSVRTMDVIIASTVILIIAAVVVGIVTGS